MVVISNLLDSMCSCLSDQACGGGVPRYGGATAQPSSSSEDVQMADSPATDADGRQSSSGSPTGSLGSARSSSPRSSPSPSHFLKFRGASGTEWQSLVRRTSCGAASAGSSSADRRPSSPSIQDATDNNVMRCLDMDNAQMALAHARQQVGARAHKNHHKRKASSDIFRSRRDETTTSASAESSSSTSNDEQQQPVQRVRSERVASPVPLGGLCAPNLNGVVDGSGGGPLSVRSLLRFPGLCFANPIRGSSSFEDNANSNGADGTNSNSTIDEADRPASPAYLLEQELADQQRRPERPMPLYASQQVVPIHDDAETGIDDGPICLADMIRRANHNHNDNGDISSGAKKMRLTAPSAPPADAKPSFAFSSSSDEEEEEEASVESTPATMTEGAEGEAPITPIALDAYGAVGTSNTATATASPPSTNVQTAAPTHQITPNFTPSSSRPHKQQRMSKSPGAALGGGIQALGSGPSVPELMFADGRQEEAPVTPGQVPIMSAPQAAANNVPVTPEKAYFDV